MKASDRDDRIRSGPPSRDPRQLRQAKNLLPRSPSRLSLSSHSQCSASTLAPSLASASASSLCREEACDLLSGGSDL